MSSNRDERRPLLHSNPNRSRTLMRSSSCQPVPSTPMSPSVSLFSNSKNSHRFTTRAASAAILLSLIFERAAFYGLAGNLVLFLNKKPLQWHSFNAIDASLYFFGVCFVMSLIGGWLADAFLGRFKAILISFVIYIAGYMLMPFMTSSNENPSKLLAVCWANDSHHRHGRLNATGGDDSDPFDEDCSWLVFLALTVIAIGSGFVKANIAPFGSDQVSRKGQQATLSFFNWFYWCINLGALLGLSVITYIEQQHNFFWGYLLSVSCLVLSTLLFLAGRCFYHVREPDGSILTNIVRIIREAFHRKRLRKQELASSRQGQNGLVESTEATEPSLSFLDYAKHRHGGVFHDALVEDVKQLKKIFAVFAVLIPYWLVYFQMQTSFLVQGLHMRLVSPFRGRILPFNGSLVPLSNTSHVTEPPETVAAWLSLFDVVILVFLLPLVDRVIYPWLERRSGVPVSISRRILLGMVFATAAMVVAGVVEHFRLKAFWPYGATSCRNESITQYIDDTPYEAADMSILWQIPQYALIGLSEVFTSVAGLQFAVSIAPRSMKGVIMGLFYLFSGIGSFLGTAVVAGLSSAKLWFLSSDFGDINCRVPCKGLDSMYVSKTCHLDYYFYLLAGIEVVGAGLFVVVSSVFHLDEQHRLSRLSIHLAEPSEDFVESVNARYRDQQRNMFRGLSSDEAGD
ncbi:hypothetical protein ACOMHN_031007 [Nucella lapillus]